MGRRKAAEVLLLDKILSAQEAKDCKWVNEIVSLPKQEFFDINLIPCIPKLLKSDVFTLENAK